MTSSVTTVCSTCGSGDDTALSRWNDSLTKRLLDIACASMVLVLSSPLMLLIAGAVRMSSPGPVLFRQKRVRKGGGEFEILKFRTMFHRRPDLSPGLTRKGDNRITPVGRLLRKWKLDELPQFVNVLRGEMSLVGPRPDLPEYYATLDPSRREVLRLKPGITGWATLHFRDEESVLAGVPPEELISFYVHDLLPRKIDLDLSYARKATFLGDIVILVRTVNLI